MQRKGKLVSQRGTRAVNIQLECDECGFQTEDPSSLYTHQAGMHRKEKLVSQGGIRTAKPTNGHTRQKDQTSQSCNKLTEATHTQSRDENIPIDNNEGMTARKQKLGSLNFPPINPGNATRENHNKCGEQPITITTKVPNFDGSQTIMEKAAPTMVPPTEVAILEVEDITVDVKNEENRDTQRDVASKHGRPPHQNTELHRSPAGPQNDTHDDTFCGTCHHTFESPLANDNHEPCEAASYYVPRRTNEQIHLTGPPMASKVIKCDTRFPPEMPHDKNNRDTSAEIRTTANAEIATICSTILLGKPNVDGSYNVNGQVTSIQELQKQIGNLQDRN